jgi:hypothetical protein
VTGKKQVFQLVDFAKESSRETITIEKWHQLFTNQNNNSNKLNVINTEMSKTALSGLITVPPIVAKISWNNSIWPDQFKAYDDNKNNIWQPKDELFCSMSMQGSCEYETIDNSCASMWYHVVSGRKDIVLIPPTVLTIHSYEVRHTLFYLFYYRLNSNHNSVTSKFHSNYFESQFKKHKEIDVLLAVSASSQIAFLKTNLPICLFADATVDIMLDYYPSFTHFSHITKYISNHIEQKAIKNSVAHVYPSHWALNSAKNKYNSKFSSDDNRNLASETNLNRYEETNSENVRRRPNQKIPNYILDRIILA